MNYDAQTVIAASLDIRLLLSSDTYRLLPALGEQIQVSSNLRLILTVPDQRKYMHTGFRDPQRPGQTWIDLSRPLT